VSYIWSNNLFDICTVRVKHFLCSVNMNQVQKIKYLENGLCTIYGIIERKRDIHVSDMFSFTAYLPHLQFYLHPNTPVLLYHAISFANTSCTYFTVNLHSLVCNSVFCSTTYRHAQYYESSLMISIVYI
jgi:hypothetical protein